MSELRLAAFQFAPRLRASRQSKTAVVYVSHLGEDVKFTK